MADDVPHRKRIHHYEDPSDCRELTFSCYERRPLLVNDESRALLGHAIDRASERHGFRLAAFVFMPEHVHLLVFPERGASGMDAFLKAVKRPFSYRTKQTLIQTNSPILNELMIQQRPGITTFRFWQEGPGYDVNLSDRRGVWNAIDYLHMNPVRRGFCDSATDWLWSSARHFLQPDSAVDERLPKLHKLPSHYLT